MEPLDIGAAAKTGNGVSGKPWDGKQPEDAIQQHVAGDDLDISPEEKQTAQTLEKAGDSSTVPDTDTPITHLYLTFNTPLPIPNTLSTSEGPDDAPGSGFPPPPDLSKYTNPLTWPSSRKNIMVCISCVATSATAYTAGSYSPAADLMAAEYGTTRIAALAGITTFCMGFALAPMVLAPYSEVTGRYPVFALSGVFFTAFQAACGAAPNLAAMLISRFITGCGGSVFSTMVGGVIADMYDKESRNTPMALFSGSVLVGTGLGPLIASVICHRLGADGGPRWKWVFWHQVILDFLVTVAVAVLFKESRGPVLLSRKAKALNKWYEALEAQGVYGVWVHEERANGFLGESVGNCDGDEDGSDLEKQVDGRRGGDPRPPARLQRIRWLVKEDEQRSSMIDMVKTSLIRPFHLLFTEPIVFFFSLWVSFAWAVLYLTFGSVPLVFREVYGFNNEQTGYVFLAMIVGSIIATAMGIYQEQLLKNPAWQRKGIEGERDASDSENDSSFWIFMRRKFPVESPESRLYFTCLTSVLLPIGLFMFGFSAQPDIHWIVPTIAISFASMGIYYVYLATFNYLADTYQTYASSALAGQSFCRNVLGGAFPLVTGLLFTNLGEDAAGGLLGAIATFLTVVPWVLVFFGESIRSRSKFAVALEHR